MNRFLEMTQIKGKSTKFKIMFCRVDFMQPWDDQKLPDLATQLQVDFILFDIVHSWYVEKAIVDLDLCGQGSLFQMYTNTFSSKATVCSYSFMLWLWIFQNKYYFKYNIAFHQPQCIFTYLLYFKMELRQLCKRLTILYSQF